MIRVHLKPLEIAKLKKCAPSYISNIRKSLLLKIFGIEGSSEAKLKKCAPSYISNIRKSLLLKIFGIEGSSELFDDEIGKIGREDAG